ncbi:MAG: aminoacyl-tRNA hydrolase [Acholeplasmatales bacterium]|jgi:PTH1 family peptidyl-tRNA hydrolase|nr:aminoacyl-tRNA hydrolase [Acholeplasmataceae bacterium]MDY0115145.1 aminoacyl-tRNA hydrolase [Acholeplasmatales bacterium]MCK9234348.1 aminoacyl-tRNA hydrolase [Acholeplasmataceae bacterium]MCK9289664.1 aminoacyl-tRNA hydrolase [Acholeplasmataceae bacterium]MCK9427471.1 aminoacyl-tRNA hydrolase [Acholeplasmataceae bacterium]
MKLIVGLGNPGKAYQKTRHNVGYQVIDLYLKTNSLKEKYESKFSAFLAKDEKAIFLKPTTYMNLSGESVLKVINYYKIELDNILIIVDDVNLELGTLRLRENGSSGGHNGLKSIEALLKTQQYKRLRIGIGKRENVTKHVLSKFARKERKELTDSYLKAVNIIDAFIEGAEFSNLTMYE